MINSILKDKSFESIYGFSPPIDVPRHLRIVQHLKYVEQFLRASTYPQQMERFKHLDRLKQYIQQEYFPKSFATRKSHPSPCFIDQEGTYCAVGYLIHCDDQEQGRREGLAEAINHRYQYHYLLDMDCSIIPGMREWIEKSEFSPLELAMIQPTYDFDDYTPTTRPPILVAVTHTSIRCDGCGMFPITGDRYWCMACKDYDLCAGCERSAVHDPTHLLVKAKAEDLKLKESVLKQLKAGGHLKTPEDLEWAELDALEAKSNIVDFVSLLIKGTSLEQPELLVKFTTATPSVINVAGVLKLTEEQVKAMDFSLVARRKILTFIERRKKLAA